MINNKAQEGAGAIGVVFVIALVIAFFVCVIGFDYVPAGRIGVMDHLGEVNPTPWGPGVKWTGLLTSTIDMNTRLQLVSYDASAASKDLQIVKTKVGINFRIDPSKAPEIYKTIGEDYQPVIITPIVQEAVKQSTAYYNAEELITDRAAVKNQITQYITDKLATKGLIVTEVSITDFDFSEEFNKAIERKQVAAQDALAAENNLKAMQYNSQAMALQKEVLEIKKLDIQLEWIKKWSGNLPTTLISNEDTVDMLLNLPTPETMKVNQDE